MIKRLLMMSDLGPTSVRAFPPLIALAKCLDEPEVVLVHTVEGSSEHTFLDDFVCEQIDVVAKRVADGPLQVQAEQLREQGLKVTTEVVIGSPFAIVHEVVRRYDADLVIMPTEGHHSLLRRVSNSATARVIRDEDMAVLVVNGVFDATHWPGWGPVVHPVDLGQNMAAGIKTASDFAELVGTELHLLHVLRPAPVMDVYDADPKLRATVVESHAEWLKKVKVCLDETAGAVGSVKTHGVVVEHDNSGAGIIGYLKQVNAGAVVLPSLGRDAVHTRLMGSVAEHVLLASPCPVLIFDKPL